MAQGEKVLEQSRSGLRGPHNAENMLAALAVGDIYGLDREMVIESICSYRALPHRCEMVGERDGVIYINDSKATNIDAMEKALMGQEAPVVLIAGGKDKGFDFAPLRPLLEKKVSHALLIGEMRVKLGRIWNGATTCHECGSLAEAVSVAGDLAKPGTVVLLSPGCSSYDMFKNFEDRGDTFRDLVQQQTSSTKQK
ncbi:MAG: hypothetical protein HC904_10750 [Blastochloris sp.]|nr:hypothetical protein [Blastochloris sp.]